jgi:hypothetical protein
MTFSTTHRYELEALMGGRFFERRYNWTGAGIEKTPIIESGRDVLGHAHHRLHGPVIYEGQWRILLVDLGRDVAPGERESVEIKHTFIDTAGTFQPFLGHTVHSDPELVPEKLVLEVQLHKTMKRDVRWEVRRAGVSTRLSSGPLTGQDGLYTWNIPDKNVTEIKPGHYYRIDWNREQR